MWEHIYDFTILDNISKPNTTLLEEFSLLHSLVN